MIHPTPKRLSNWSSKDCTYCAYNAQHPSPAASDWSSEDWDGDKAKGREQRSLINFKLVDAQVTDTTQETMIDKHEKDLVNGMDNLTLDADNIAPTGTLALKLDEADTSTPRLDMTENEHEVEGMKDENITLTYNMMEQE